MAMFPEDKHSLKRENSALKIQNADLQAANAELSAGLRRVQEEIQHWDAPMLTFVQDLLDKHGSSS